VLSVFLEEKKRPTTVKLLIFNTMLVVPVGGLEPPRREATDFESVVYTNFTTPAHCGANYTELTKLVNGFTLEKMNKHKSKP
jgi:hypothetical protein